jgi:hypothetical protein
VVAAASKCHCVSIAYDGRGCWVYNAACAFKGIRSGVIELAGELAGVHGLRVDAGELHHYSHSTLVAVGIVVGVA